MLYLKNSIRKKKAAKRIRFISTLYAIQTLEAPVLHIWGNLDVLFLVQLSIAPTKRKYWIMIYGQ